MIEYISIRVRSTNAAARVRLNDVQIVGPSEGDQLEKLSTVNEWLAADRSIVTVELQPTDPSAAIRAEVAAVVTYPKPSAMPLGSWKYDENRPAGLRGEFAFRPVNQQPVWAHQRAAQIVQLGARDTAAVAESYRAIRAAVVARDVDGIMRLGRLRTSELAAAYGQDPREFDAMSRADWGRFAGLELQPVDASVAGLRFDVEGDGRVVRLRRHDGDEPLSSVPRRGAWSMKLPMWFARVDGEWTWVR